MPTNRLLCFLLFAYGICFSLCAGEALTLQELKSGNVPAWAKPRSVRYASGKKWQVFRHSRVNADQMKKGVGMLRGAIKSPTDEADRPFFILQLGRHLTDLDADAYAYQTLTRMQMLPPDTPHDRKTYMLPTLDAVKREGQFHLLRILARNMLGGEASSYFDALVPQNGYERVRIAECYALLGEQQKAEALLPTAHGSGNPEQGFSDFFVRLRGAVLARSLGNNELARQLADPVLKNGPKAQKWPQYQSTWEILDTLMKNVDSGKSSGQWTLKNGSYRGTCRGFVGPVTVQVRIANGALDTVKVVKTQDDRPWSAMEVMPQRIERRKSLVVDTVTGATVSSCAILTATDQALTAAAQ